MTDTVTLNPNSGVSTTATFATDDISGVHHQRVKVEFGADGVASDVSAATPLPVNPGILASALSNGGQDVATTSTPVIAANASRSLLILSNGSDTGIWITFAVNGAANGMGLYLAPGVVFTEAYSGAVCAMNVGSGIKRLGVVEL